MKIFFASVATGIAVILTLQQFPRTAAYVRFMRQQYLAEDRGFLAAILGGALLGVGAVLSGSLPEHAAVQLGAGISNGLWTVMGCILGTVVFLLYEQRMRLWLNRSPVFREQKLLDSFFRTAYHNIAIPLLLATVTIVTLLEINYPWRTNLPGLEAYSSYAQDSSLYSYLAMRAWSPIACGIIIGLLQLPAIAILGDMLSTIDGYISLALNLIGMIDTTQVPMSKETIHLRTGVSLWKPIFVLGALVGGYTSATIAESGQNVGTFNAFRCLLGGFLMLLGARIAGNKTNSSAVAALSTLSLVSLPVMFASGTLTAYLLYHP
ncbi:hypothetical protein QOT17_000729 [Balamuthia mandrillaris]